MRKFLCIMSVFAIMLALCHQAQAQQGKYVNSASARLVKLVDQANKDGYKLQNDGFSIGGGWLKQGTDNWISVYNITLTKGKEYRFLGAGDMDAEDVDLRILDEAKNVVASDTGTAPTAEVNYRPGNTGRYTVQVRLYRSKGNVPSVCIATMMVR